MPHRQHHLCRSTRSLLVSTSGRPNGYGIQVNNIDNNRKRFKKLKCVDLGPIGSTKRVTPFWKLILFVFWILNVWIDRHLEKIISQDLARTKRCDIQNVTKGNLVLAPFAIPGVGNAYYRAKVLNISNAVKPFERLAQVYFIDFGKVQKWFQFDPLSILLGESLVQLSGRGRFNHFFCQPCAGPLSAFF